MDKYNYELVRNLSIGQLIDKLHKGEKFYFCSGSGPQYSEFTLHHVNCVNASIDGVYTRVKAPWWEPYVGKLVMVRDNREEEWVPVYFRTYDSDAGRYKFRSVLGTGWEYMRPLTSEEKENIITYDEETVNG